jgi:thiamine pyrophosphokinase
MDTILVNSTHGVTLVGGGEIYGALLAEAVAHAPRIVAADGGARNALAHGLQPEAVIGDFDSLDAETRARLDPAILHEIAEQETTDFDKCLRRIRAPFVIAAGFTGARLDHELAAFSALAAHPSRACLLLGREDVAFLAPPDLTLGLSPGTRVSLFPMSEARAESEGLRWPLKGLAFAPDGRIGTSNEALGAAQRIRILEGRMLVLLPRPCLRAAITALAPGFAAPPAARGG